MHGQQHSDQLCVLQDVISAFADPAVRGLVEWDAEATDMSLLGARPLCLAAVTNSNNAVVVSLCLADAPSQASAQMKEVVTANAPRKACNCACSCCK